MAEPISKKRKIALLGLCLLEITEKKNKRVNRTKWTKKWVQEREKYGHIPLVKELRENEVDDFRNYLRMTTANFDEILKLTSPYIKKQDTVLRNAISAEERLIATLRFLATGRSYADLKFSTGIAAQTLGYIIPETCQAICKALRQFLIIPETKEEWKEIAKGFKNRWQVINCGGVIDGKHIRIIPPPGTGALYYNYKIFYSIVLLAVVNHNYEFLYVDIGKQGRISDGGVFSSTLFGQRLKENSLNLPNSGETENGLNFVFIGDEAFPLGPHLLTPYPKSNLNHEKRIYNYRISRARNTVENTFGLISSVFRILHTPINIAPTNINYVVLAICYLHKFLRKRSPSYAKFTSLHEDNENDEVIRTPDMMTSLQNNVLRNSSNDAKINRDQYREYYNGQGKVPWQEEMISAGKN